MKNFVFLKVNFNNAINEFGDAAKRVYEHIHCNIKEIHALEEVKTVLLAQLSSR